MSVLELEEIISVGAAMAVSEGMVTLRSHGLSLDIAVVDVTPELAARWLKLDDGNRTVKDGLIVKYARDMSAGEWPITGQSVIFADTGALLDGQHRLRAIVKSGVTVPILVVSGVPEVSKYYLDIGKKRSVADQLTIEGRLNASLLGAGARLALAWSTNRLSRKASSVISESETRRFIADNTYLDVAADFAAMIRRRWNEIAPSAVCAAMWGLAGAGHEESGRLFFVAVADMRTEGQGDPKHTLRAQVSRTRGNGQRIENGHLLSMIIRAYNADHEGRELRTLPLSGSKSVPVIPPITPLR